MVAVLLDIPRNQFELAAQGLEFFPDRFQQTLDESSGRKKGIGKGPGAK
jgi:hypothetical protein